MNQFFAKKNNIGTQVCFYGVILLAFSFFLSPSTKLTGNILKFGILLPVLIFIPKQILYLFKERTLFRLSVLYLAFMLLSMIWGEDPFSAGKFIKQFRCLLYIVTFLTAYSVAFTACSEKVKTTLVQIGAIAVAIGACYSLSYFLSHIMPNARLGYHLHTTHPNKTGWLYGFVAIALLSTIKEKRSWKELLAFAAILSTLFTAVLFTSSRSAILGIMLSSGCFCILTKDRRIFCALAALTMAFLFYSLTSVYLSKNPHLTAAQSETSLQMNNPIIQTTSRVMIAPDQLWKRKGAGRTRIWKTVLGRMSPTDYLWGKGLLAHDGTDHERIQFAHSTLLSSLYKGGVIALTLHLSILISTGYMSLKLIKNKIYAPLLLFLFALFPLTIDGRLFFAKPTPESLLFWIPVALVLAATQLPPNLFEKEAL
jgi:hypothetical protein